MPWACQLSHFAQVNGSAGGSDQHPFEFAFAKAIQRRRPNGFISATRIASKCDSWLNMRVVLFVEVGIEKSCSRGCTHPEQ